MKFFFRWQPHKEGCDIYADFEDEGRGATIAEFDLYPGDVVIRRLFGYEREERFAPNEKQMLVTQLALKGEEIIGEYKHWLATEEAK